MSTDKLPSYDDVLSPANASELLQRQEALQAEARGILAELGLIPLLASAGTPSQIGSSVPGLLMWRDIDVEVLCDAWAADLAFQTIRPLASHPRVKRLSFVNEAGRFKPPGLRDGYYWGVRYHADTGDEWKIDVWFWPREASAGDVAHADELRNRLTPETRLAILRIKDALHEQLLYRSVDLYDAVLNHGIRTPSEFAAYQRKRR